MQNAVINMLLSREVANVGIFLSVSGRFALDYAQDFKGVALIYNQIRRLFLEIHKLLETKHRCESITQSD